MNAEELENREVLFDGAWHYLGIERDTSALAHDRYDASGAVALKVRFPRQAEDPREVELGEVENELGLASAYEWDRRVGGAERKPYYVRTHLANTYNRPVIDSDGVSYPLQLFNLSTNPPSDEISRFKLCQRVEVDAPVDTATWEGALARARRIKPDGPVQPDVLRGFQNVRLVLAAGLIAEVTYVREFFHHIEVPKEIRLDRCGIVVDSPPYFNVSGLIVDEVTSHAARRGITVSERSVYQDGGNCVCCWQRTITVRPAKPSELPSGSSRQRSLVGRLASLIRRLCSPGRHAADPLAVNVCAVPDINRLNFGPFDEVPEGEPFNPVISDEEREAARWNL